MPNASGVAGGGDVGIGFAVPASTAQRIVDELLATGRATHPWIGAVTAEDHQDMADRFGTPSGLFVQDVSEGGPADAAGLEAGDIITRLSGNPATGLGLGWLLVSAKVGDDIDRVRPRRRLAGRDPDPGRATRSPLARHRGTPRQPLSARFGRRRGASPGRAGSWARSW